MYRVVEMYGVDEPWWFFDDWKKDIVSTKEFENFYTALKYYRNQWYKFAESFTEFKSKDDLLSAFWDVEDEIWCEECAGYQQRYHSIALLEDWHLLPEEKKRWAYEKHSADPQIKVCPNALKARETKDSLDEKL
ncbi:DUF1033 family protein [Lactococcus termiticola]|uniref:DNA binding protein n=1 Tax=Lactococcus termiticola TaxID=2169526 RepID=A0A2R5HJX1_9LACT|nr:DUF1033 family protein [Lactococcus termiticola]GBG96990.1 DNA binding protein [Lactococcus termiticola]